MTEGAPAVLDDELVRYQRPLVRDARLHDELRRAGYAVVPDRVVPDDDVRALHDLAAELASNLDGPAADLFATVGRIVDPAVRADLLRRAADVVLPLLEPLFVDGAVLDGTTLLLKPPSPTSELNPHQDSSLVDETEFLGVYAWAALDDTDVANGGLHVLPGSHRLGNLQRTLNVPWQLAPYHEAMVEESVPLAVPAGHVVLFDAATVHWSPPNRTDRARLAANSFARPAEAPLMHFYRDDATSPGMVEAYQVDLSFFLDDDIMVRPGPRHRALGERPQHLIRWTGDEFRSLCRQARVESEPLPGRDARHS